MERLTERDMNCPDPKGGYGVHVKDNDYVATAHRLAAYEAVVGRPGLFRFTQMRAELRR